MSRRKKVAPAIDLAETLQSRVTVKLNGTSTVMEPFQAQFEQCVHAALSGDIRACTKFINWCLKEQIITPMEPFDDHQYLVIIPNDWDRDEFRAMYDRYGPPPWPGLRDGLTPEERELRRSSSRRRKEQPK